MILAELKYIIDADDAIVRNVQQYNAATCITLTVTLAAAAKKTW